MNTDIFEDMKQCVGCADISDLPNYKREVWQELKKLPPSAYPLNQLENFSRSVFGVRYSILTAVMEQQKGRDLITNV